MCLAASSARNMILATLADALKQTKIELHTSDPETAARILQEEQWATGYGHPSFACVGQTWQLRGQQAPDVSDSQWRHLSVTLASIAKT